MNVLILAVSAGGGHIKAAEAIKNYILLNEKNSKVEILDTLKYINPILDKLVIGGYIKAIKKSPSLYGKLYNYNYYQMDNTLASVSNKINELMANRLLPLIKDFAPDIIVSTHPFPNEMLSILNGNSQLKIPTLSIITDYACHSFWLYSGIDAYIASNEEMICEMVSMGIKANTIFNYGIPVLPKFLEPCSKEMIFSELNLDTGKPTVLVMGGSLGIGKISDVYSELCSIEHPLQIIIITGSNKKLFKELSELSENSKKVTRIIGYTDKVNNYMQCCDLLITKPGGITITEALACGTPMALFSPIPGQEERNANFLVKNYLAINLEDFHSYKEGFESLFNSKEKFSIIKNNCSKFYNENCGNDIYNLMKKIIANAMTL
ncbi:MGDG synthase family glycosyltransferase [Haloimpatiens lingqiaonensis]|uniref:MGDG synthase family glycosyltransferase n=1 Tax=Haloimpatiens lingqiaonensis TaxID=1380675 RepID=UPI0010FD31E8|nr:glycosyltransferase [Haloimpatiens lingqiaonensis]